MPTYEYVCRDCGEHLEVVQSFDDDHLEECPRCGGELRRVFSPAGIIFKGSGWHSTDYGRSSAPSSDDGRASGGAATDGNETDGKDKAATSGNGASSNTTSESSSEGATEKSA